MGFIFRALLYQQFRGELITEMDLGFVGQL